jgi:hypothetical protein
MADAFTLTGNGSSGPGEADEEIKVYRHELKYFISFTNYQILSTLLRAHMQMEPNCIGKRDNSYWIRSLYFDTAGNKDFYEKQIGYNLRKKIRLRIYDVNQPFAKLEIKNKNDQFMMKETASLSREDAEALIRGSREVLFKSGLPILYRVFYLMSEHFYRPAILVDYYREAYVAPIQHIRITFDKEIKASNVDFRLFAPDLQMQPVFDEPTMVLEVKFHRFLPNWIKGLLSSFAAERSAISKYCLGRFIY